MKKMFRIACVGAVLCAALSAFAVAADFTQSADRLHELGLFQGTQNGYELDRAPTRAEAAAMLTRLLGKEAEAKGLTYSAPFTDLQNWEKPYVQYLYENGLTTGATATTYEPEAPLTANMYAAFLLRALGYSDAAGDFTYRGAADYAESLGVYDDVIVDAEHFLRDHVVAASYTALSAQPKGSDKTLLRTLADQGAVDKTAAEPYLKQFAVYQEYRKATEGMDSLKALQLSHKLTGSISSSWENREQDKLFDLVSEETLKLDLVAPALLSERTVTLRTPDGKEKAFIAESYTADDMRYVSQNGVKSRMAQTAKQMKALTGSFARVPAALVEDIAKSANGYVITYNQAGLNRLDAVLGAAADAVGALEDMTLYSVTVKHNVSGGRIVSQGTTVEFDGGTVAGTLMSVMELEAADGEVVLTPPENLSQYPLVKQEQKKDAAV